MKGVEALNIMQSALKQGKSEAILLGDADDAFNSVNRNVVFRGTKMIFLSLSTYARRYSSPGRFFATGST